MKSVYEITYIVVCDEEGLVEHRLLRLKDISKGFKENGEEEGEDNG